MTITVTQEDIDNGVKWDCKYCPVALSLCRETKTSGWRVAGTKIYKNNWIGVLAEKFYTPSNVIDFILDFDAGLPVKPFSFELEVA